MTFVCFSSKALSNNTINLLTIVFVNIALVFDTVIFVSVFCLVIEKSTIRLLRLEAMQSGKVAICISL